MLQWTNDSLREAEWAHIFIHMGTGWEVPLWPCDVTWLALYWKFPVEENNRAEIKKCIFRIESILTCEQLIWTSQQLLQSSTRPSNTFHMSCWAIWHREILILPPPVLAVHDRLAHHRATPHCEATFKYTCHMPLSGHFVQCVWGSHHLFPVNTMWEKEWDVILPINIHCIGLCNWARHGGL